MGLHRHRRLPLAAAALLAGSCSSDPTAGVEPSCGNGIAEPGEECDDGNLVDTDGCMGCRVRDFLVDTLEPVGLSRPSVAMAPDGRFVVVWNTGWYLADESDLRARIYDSLGMPAGEEFAIADEAGRLADDVDVEMSPSGGFVAAWRSTAPMNEDPRISARAFGDSGSPICPEIPIGDGPYVEDPDVAVGPDGRLLIAWSDGLIKVMAFDATCAALGPAVTVNGHHGEAPEVSSTPDGRFVIVWEAPGAYGDPTGEIWGQRLHQGGTWDRGPFLIAEAASYHAPEPRLAIRPGGGIVVAWDDQQPECDYLCIVGQAGEPDSWFPGDWLRLNEWDAGIQTEQAVAASAEGIFAAAWSSDDQDWSGMGVFVGLFGPDSGRAAGEIRASWNNVGDQRNPDVAMAPDGRFVVVWNEVGYFWPGGIWAQRYLPDGTPLGLTPW